MSETAVPEQAQTGSTKPGPEGTGAALQEFRQVFDAYRAETRTELPLGSYAVLAGLWNAAMFGFYQAAKRSGRIPERIGWSDLLLLGIATHKLSRLLTKDWVTSPLRAPFTKYQEADAAGEVTDTARGHGMQRAIGDLFT